MNSTAGSLGRRPSGYTSNFNKRRRLANEGLVNLKLKSDRLRHVPVCINNLCK